MGPVQLGQKGGYHTYAGVICIVDSVMGVDLCSGLSCLPQTLAVTLAHGVPKQSGRG